MWKTWHILQASSFSLFVENYVNEFETIHFDVKILKKLFLNLGIISSGKSCLFFLSRCISSRCISPCKIKSFLKFLLKNYINDFKTIHFDIITKLILPLYLQLLWGAIIPLDADYLNRNDFNSQLFKSDAIKVVFTEILEITSVCEIKF